MLDGKQLDLTLVASCLPNTLHSHLERIFLCGQLMSHAYLDYRVVTDRTVNTHVRNLRRKFDQAPLEREVMQSVYGIGFHFKG